MQTQSSRRTAVPWEWFSTPKLHIFVLLALAVPLVFTHLGQNSLHNSDEALYALVSRDTSKTSDWVSLHHQGKPWFVKAPLLFWGTAALYRLFGVSEFTARFWSATFAVATLIALYWLSARIFSPQVAILASFILLTSTQFIYYHGAKTGELDTALTFFTTCSLLLFVLARQDQKYLYAAGFSVGLALMSKHLTYIVPIASTLGIYMVLTRSGKSFSGKVWGVGLGVVAVTALPWHLVEWIRHGEEFLRIYFFQEVYEPAVNWKSHPLGSWFYFVTIKDGLFPWSLLLPFSLIGAFSKPSRSRLATNLLLIVWSGVLFAVITASEIKLSWYILPAYPALAMLMAQFIAEFINNRVRRYLDYSFLAGITLLMLATKTVDHPFEHLASHGMAEVHFFEPVRALAGPPEWVLWILMAIGLSLIFILWTRFVAPSHAGAAGGWLRWALVLAFMASALYHVVTPLRLSDHKSEFHQACLEVAKFSGSSRQHLIALPIWKKKQATLAYYFENVCPTDLEIVNPWELVTRIELMKPGRIFLADRERLERFPANRRVFQNDDLEVLYENREYIVFKMSPQ